MNVQVIRVDTMEPAWIMSIISLVNVSMELLENYVKQAIVSILNMEKYNAGNLYILNKIKDENFKRWIKFVKKISVFSISDINECASEPCLHNERCTDEINGFICECLPGFTGKHCETGKTLSSHYILLVLSLGKILVRSFKYLTSSKNLPNKKPFQIVFPNKPHFLSTVYTQM